MWMSGSGRIADCRGLPHRHHACKGRNGPDDPCNRIALGHTRSMGTALVREAPRANRAGCREILALPDAEIKRLAGLPRANGHTPIISLGGGLPLRGAAGCRT